MTSKELKLIEARIKDELVSIQSLLRELEGHSLIGKDTTAASQLEPEESFLLRAVGSVLHDFYVAAENVFEVVARELDEHLPEGIDWHMQLLRQMSVSVRDVRPALLSKSTLQLLDKYRSFRHVFRNVYGFSLDATRLAALVDDLENTSRHFKHDVEAFLDETQRIMAGADRSGTVSGR